MYLDTIRCNIRPFKAEDIDAFMAYRNDMDWMKYQGFKGLTKQEYTKALLGNHSLTDGIQLAVICRQTNTLIGDLYLKQEAETCWIGYTITPLEARHGYVYEAVSAVICFLAAQGITCIKAGVTNGNDASVSLLKKLKFTFLSIEEDEQIFELNLI
jgi:RimJ/RimL family protein N-acetyltransferase